jgi:uncharacterized membrane protein YidH (DUF202 family)
MSLIAFLFLIPTLIVTFWAIFIPVYKEIRARRPKNYVTKHYLVYFTVTLIISTLFAPVLFYILIFGNCNQFKTGLINELIESEKYYK